MNNNEIKQHVGATLKRLRTENKITQKELGDYLGVKNSTISAWESGQNSIDMTVLFNICDYLGVSVTEFKKDERTNIALSDEEKTLILNYRKLSNENKAKVMGFIEMAKE